MVNKKSHRKGIKLEEEYGKEKAKLIREKQKQAKLKNPIRYWLRKKFDENHKEKLSLAKKGKPCDFIKTKFVKGQKFSKESIKKSALSRKGKLYRVIDEKELNRIRKISEKTRFSKSRWKNKDFKEKILKLQRISMNIKPNKPEKIMIDLIQKNNLPFNYVGDGKIWFRGETQCFNPDFLSKNPKHIIEVFGDYWHKNTKKNDEERLITYSKYGYKTLIIWEHELNYPNQTVEKIKRFLGDL